MESVTFAQEIEAAFERGRAVGRVEGLAFDGVARILPLTLGAEFRFSGGWFQSYVNYERKVLEELRRVQQGQCDQLASLREHEARLSAARRYARDAREEARELAWAHRRWLLWSRPWLDQVAHAEAMLANGHRRDSALRILEQNVAAELSKVRAAVDAELEEGRGRACIVDAMRAAPNRPSGVREYRDIDDFVREDKRRALRRWQGVTDAGGMDFGYRWRLEDPVQRWNTTEWRVSWLGFDDPTHEIYAIERLRPGHRDNARSTGRVWLLGVLPDLKQVHRVIDEHERHAQRERNSLVIVAHAVRSAIRAVDVATPCASSTA